MGLLPSPKAVGRHVEHVEALSKLRSVFLSGEGVGLDSVLPGAGIDLGVNP